jgi:hypothetical protein
MAKQHSPLANIIPVATDAVRPRGLARPVPTSISVFAGWGPKL